MSPNSEFSMEVFQLDCPFDDPEVLHKIKERDEATWQYLYRYYYDQLRTDVLKSLRKRGLEDISLEDVTQEVWEIAYTQIESFTWRKKDSLYHWLRVIGFMRVQKRLEVFKLNQKKLISVNLEKNESSSSSAQFNWLFDQDKNSRPVESRIQNQETFEALQQALGRVKNGQHREILQRWLFWDETPQQIASTYTVNPKTVSMVVWRFLSRFRKTNA